MSDNVFGFADQEPDPQGPAQPGAAPFAHVPPEEEGPPVDGELGESPLVPAAPAPPGPTIPGEPGTTEGAPPTQPAGSRWVGEGRKYADHGALEQGYENALHLSDRQGQRLSEMEGQLRASQEMLQRAAQLVYQQQGQQGPQIDPAILREAEQAGWDESSLRLAQTLADQTAARRVAGVEAQMRAQQERFEQESTINAYRGELGAFERAHAAEFTADPSLPYRVRDAFQALDVWEDDPLPPTGHNLEIALEAAANPALLEVLQAVPDFIDTDAGMALARRMATEGTPPKPGAPSPKPAQVPVPHVETGPTGPRPAAEPEEWGVLKLIRDRQKNSSPLGI